MYINKSRIQNVDKYLTLFKEDENISVILSDLNTFEKQLFNMGFSEEFDIGEQLLPPIIGPISRVNAIGKEIILDDLPKLTFYVSQDRDFKDWHGNNHSRTIDIPYKKFQREYIDAYSVELIIRKNNQNNKILTHSTQIKKSDKELVKHIINLFLELFGSCEIVGTDYLSKVKTKIKKVNWHILPQGEMPWERLKHNLNEMLDTVKVEHKEDALNRFEFINKFAPNFVARGNGGFNDYVVFAFEDKNLFVMENAFAGNATYVFKDDWINISQLTKAQILKENLQEDRLIHKKNWKRLITEKLG